MPKVSVIVPVHNPGKYLKPLLDSIINQTLKDIEILLIDDGSTDGSRDILKEYEQQDNRIQVFFRTPSSTENFQEKYSVDLGRQKAIGEYIMILDHDDELFPKAIENLYLYTDNNTVDVIQGRSIKVDNNNDNQVIYETPNFFPKATLLGNWSTLNEKDILYHLIECPIALWACLIRNEFQKDIELADCVYNDNSFIWKLKLLANKWIYIPNYVYKHNGHDDSVSAQENKYAFEIFKNFLNLEHFIKEKDFNPAIWYIYALFHFKTLLGQLSGLDLSISDLRTKFMNEFAKEIQRNIDITDTVELMTNNAAIQLYKQLKTMQIII